MTAYSRSDRATHWAPILWGMTVFLAHAACATDPPPRAAQIDPANPSAAEARPLEVSHSTPAALKEEPTAETPAPPGADVAAEAAVQKPNGSDADGGVAKPEEAAVYTCPMHHEVVSPKPGVCPKCGMKLVLKAPSPKQGKAHKHEHGAGGSR
jgi:hypothetical protein